jgi:hypothetical protein
VVSCSGLPWKVKMGGKSSTDFIERCVSIY